MTVITVSFNSRISIKFIEFFEWMVLRINQYLKNSATFSHVKESRIQYSAILSIVIFFFLWGGTLFLGRLALLPLIELLPNHTVIWVAFSSSLRKVLLCGAQVTAFWTWVKFIEKRRFSMFGSICKKGVLAYLKGFFIGLSSIAAITFLCVGFGVLEINFNHSVPAKALLHSTCIAVVGWGVQSASEEIGVRGWLIPVLGVRYRPLVAILLTGGVFGAIHLFNTGATALSFINLTLSGVFFAIYAIHEGRLWGVCGLHLGWNFAQGNIFGLSISGEQSSLGTLFATKSVGKDVLTGGAFGLEGSLIVTLFLICGISTLCFMRYRTHSAKTAE